MRSRNDFLQEIVRKYQEAGHKLPASPKDIARWAIDKKYWQPRPEAIINQCADQIARAMSVEYFEDAEGNRIRAKHAVVSHDGPHQYVIWDDIRTGEVKMLKIAQQQRRKIIAHECKQLKNDNDYLNTYRCPEEPMRIVFNFELDLEEMDLVKKKKRAA
jgi:hypothetical protein